MELKRNIELAWKLSNNTWMTKFVNEIELEAYLRAFKARGIEYRYRSSTHAKRCGLDAFRRVKNLILDGN